MILPNLIHVGGDLNVQGNQQVDEHSFPNLEVVKGNLVLAHSGFQRLPAKLNQVGGDVVMSKSSPASLLEDVKRLKKKGVILGAVKYCD